VRCPDGRFKEALFAGGVSVSPREGADALHQQHPRIAVDFIRSRIFARCASHPRQALQRISLGPSRCSAPLDPASDDDFAMCPRVVCPRRRTQVVAHAYTIELANARVDMERVREAVEDSPVRRDRSRRSASQRHVVEVIVHGARDGRPVEAVCIGRIVETQRSGSRRARSPDGVGSLPIHLDGCGLAADADLATPVPRTRARSDHGRDAPGVTRPCVRRGGGFPERCRAASPVARSSNAFQSPSPAHLPRTVSRRLVSLVATSTRPSGDVTRAAGRPIDARRRQPARSTIATPPRQPHG
jgi:hypothetical protein